MFDKIDLSVSSYDTAWVAMVPSPNSPKDPFFPECVNWLLCNQLRDGSWCPSNLHPLFTKDALLSTLACILALKQWNVGEEQINKGLHFIESNLASAADEEEQSPVGFNILFPAMIESATNLKMNLPFGAPTLDAIFHRRDFELKRGYATNSEGWRAFLAYISEGFGNSQNWELVMKYQRRNGSLFNSPATTASAFTHIKNADCLKYLRTLLEKFGNAVPTVYPLHKHVRLSMVASLESLGVDRHFREEIRSVLDETYRCWLQGDEDIFSDAATCAMAFRLLRIFNFGYLVFHDFVLAKTNATDLCCLLDPLTQYSEDRFFNSLGGYMKNIGDALELFRASETIIHPDESVLEKQHYWTSHFLKQELSNTLIQGHRLNKHIGLEVADALKIPRYAILGRLSTRTAIKYYNTDSTRILKSYYRLTSRPVHITYYSLRSSYVSCLNIGNEDFLKLAVDDFNNCQSIHREELNHFTRWVEEYRLDKLKFARQKQAYCYFSAAATLFPPELSDARISWAKNGVLTTVVDDFFDVGGSEEELINLIQLVEKWDVNVSVDCCSENVEIIFSALKNTINEIGAKAFTRQGCSVTSHVIGIWLDLIKSAFKEAEWLRNKSVPTMEEYMENAYVSFALGPIVLPALYLVGPQLSEEAVGSSEFHHLYRLMSTAGRLLNDIQGFKRESAEGKLNAVSLAMIHGSGITEEEAINEMKNVIVSKRRELLRLVLLEKGSVVPRACKDLFWNMSKVLHLFYAKHDGFTAHDMMKTAYSVIEEPILLSEQ
ncbi:hypothetical protein DVH24_021952 [Malus domestica]|uniref:ent-kaurene synthase n=1 Tax=Malus domestica TaxID=3750 RepID=A0A498ITS1_MALDO|nr:hypothetical protein DVH24_021952 [Malus domestica]